MTEQEQRNVEILRAAYEACRYDDGDAFLDLFADNATYRLSAPEHSVFGGIVHGPQGIRELLTRMFELVEIGDLRTDHYVAQGDNVVVTGTETVVIKKTEKPFFSEWAQYFRFCEEKVVESVCYQDYSPLLRTLDQP